MVGPILFAVSQSWVPLPSSFALSSNARLDLLWKPVANVTLLEFKTWPSGFPSSMHGALKINSSCRVSLILLE